MCIRDRPNPVWFLWDGSSLLIYSMPDQAKLKHIARSPRVALHLDSQDSGDDIVVVTGTAAIDPTAPPVHENAPYVEKYATEMRRLELGTPETMAKTYSVPIRLTPRRCAASEPALLRTSQNGQLTSLNLDRGRGSLVARSALLASAAGSPWRQLRFSLLASINCKAISASDFLMIK